MIRVYCTRASAYKLPAARGICLFIVLWGLFCSPVCTPAREPVIPVHIKQLYADVHALTSIQPPRSYQNVSSLNRAAAYIFERFGKYSSRVEIQEYTAKGNQYKNVIASFGPDTKQGQRIVVGAHYDVCGEQPGADDNASGVAAILELARLFAERKPHLKRRIDLAAYSLEEPPFFRTPYMGSAVHAKSLAEANVKVHVMVSVDMIGYFSDEVRPSRLFAPFIKPGTVIPGCTVAILGKKWPGKGGREKITGIIKKYMTEGSEGITVAALNLPEDTRGIDFSDHLNFWRHGYTAVMLSTIPVSTNPYYHRPADTIDTLDFNKMSEVVKGLYRTLINL